jgi:predicted RNase H-like nuclease
LQVACLPVPPLGAGGTIPHHHLVQAVGADVFKGRWVAVVLDDGRFSAAGLFDTFGSLLHAFPTATAVGVDIPIGLPSGAARRPADTAARTFLGPRRNSVFWTPPLEVLQAATHAEATILCQQLTGASIAIQSYGLR